MMSVAIGVLLFVGGIFLLLRKQEVADILFGFYNRPRAEGKLAWLDTRLWEPPREACLVIATIFSATVAVIGLVVFVLNVR